MKNDITVDRIANSIVQRKKKYDNFILVEGSHDRLFFLKFQNALTQIEITFGWEKLIEIINALKIRGFEKVIGIIDKDLRNIIPEISKYENNVLTTDEHDLNVMCIEKSFDTIFNSYCSQEKVDKFKIQQQIDCIKDYTHNLAKPISFLKILNKRESLNLSFKSNGPKNKLDYSKFIDKNKYEVISNDKLVETIINFSRSKTEKEILTSKEILIMLESLIKSETYNSTQINSGHDFGELICLGLKKALATREIDSDTFLKENILNYDSSDFVMTDIYKKIKILEKSQNTLYLKI